MKKLTARLVALGCAAAFAAAQVAAAHETFTNEPPPSISRSPAAPEASKTISLSVTDERRVFARDIGRGLLLRVVKESSVSRRHFGWRLEVVRRPYRLTSPNLIYQNRSGHGADPSQVYAWHVSEGQFPNERELRVRGYPYTVRVRLVDCKVEGRGPEAGFTSGEMIVSWERRR